MKALEAVTVVKGLITEARQAVQANDQKRALAALQNIDTALTFLGKSLQASVEAHPVGRAAMTFFNGFMGELRRGR